MSADAKKKKKSGRSKAAGLASRGIEVVRTDLSKVYPEDLHLITDPDHPLYDPRVEDEVSMDDPIYVDIFKNGVENPVHVRENGKDAYGKAILQVIRGRHRVKILRHINEFQPVWQVDPKTKAQKLVPTPADPRAAFSPTYAPTRRRIPIMIQVGSDKEMVLSALADNALRNEETPYTLAVKMGKALKEGASEEEIAQSCNFKTPGPVKQYLTLLNFIPEVQQAFHKGSLPIGAIKTFKDVPREEQGKVLAGVVASGAGKNHEVRAAAKATREGTEYKAPEQKKLWGRGQIEKWRDGLAKKITDATLPSEPLNYALATLSFLLNGDTAALKDYPELQETAFAAAMKGVA